MSEEVRMLMVVGIGLVGSVKRPSSLTALPSQFLINLILPSLQAVPRATGAKLTRPQLQIPNSPSPLQTSSPLFAHERPPKRSAGLVPVGAAILAVPAVAGITRLLKNAVPGTEAESEADANSEADADADAEIDAEADADAEATIGNDEDGLICRRTTSRFLISSAGAGTAEAKRVLSPRRLDRIAVFIFATV